MKAKISIEWLERMSAALRVLAHPHRLKIIELLEDEGLATVSRIHTALRLPQAVTSQHLGQMKRVGILISTRKGKEVWYEIADSRALTILDCMRKKEKLA
ncbi:MAG TPA: metalloregulator ArsR/SmtB family transcription factor [Kiritimatiellia bacterium]|nr:metalloregulator ArsR/SmtB family transcription factor [Kiritimatiellia bacterium]